MGDSWISPIDSVLTWGPYLYSTVSNCDSNFHLVCCLTVINRVLTDQGKVEKVREFEWSGKVREIFLEKSGNLTVEDL